MKHITERVRPDKAIDVIDEVGAYQRTLPDTKRKKTINVADIENMVALMARVPSKSVNRSDKESISALCENLKMLVYGQDKAIEALVDTIKLARAGLRDLNKPWGSFLFAGPTGVGKTEVTNQLAALLGIELLRFDMSEYMESHTVSRLIGSPPGYVGYDQGGLLTDAVMKHPYSVVLLDEMEKAHSDIYNILLQVMDNGFLTDNNGRKADFRHVVIVMTTNAGSSVSSRNSMGFTDQDHMTDGMIEVEKLFAPEFRNRLDAVIQFESLSKKDIVSVVDKFLAQLQGQLDAKGVSLEIDDKAKKWLAINGYDEKMGARPMSRLIQDKIKKPLAEEILFGRLSSGGKVRLVKGKSELELDFN
jgi:ATP-dependent Clp protease ATP-binding subunit ClpA